MPLLNRKAFRTDPPPSDLKENEEIFVCRQTNEVYRDYESFFKRTILCNSLVWSCEVTLKHSLTYEEALDCEREARKVAARIAVPIQQGVLTLVHYTRHSRLDNLCDEVYNYIRNRYQEGEEVEVKYKGEKLFGYIHNVIEPTSLTNGFDSKLSSPTSKEHGSKKLTSPHGKNKSGKNSNLASPSKSNSEVIVLSDGESNNKSGKSTLPSPLSSKSTSKWPDAKCYQYEVKLKNIKTNTKIPEFVTVKQANVSRKKGAFTREKLKLLLRVTCRRSAPTPENGFWVVNDEYQKKFDLSPDVNISLDIPDKIKSKKRKSDGTLNDKSGWKKRKLTNEEKEKNKKKSGDIKKKDKGKEDDNKLKQMKGLKKMSAEEIERVKLEMKIQREKEREIRKKERDVERELKKNERNKARQEKMELLREQKLFLLHWCVPQDDLDLDDHKELPTPVPVQSKFSGEMFGNIVMVLEFLHIFGEFFDMKQDFPDGVTLEMLEEALTEHDAEGLFYDIMKFLLQCILKTHAEEEEEEGLDDSDVQAQDEAENENENDATEESDFTRVKKAVSASASMAAVWAQLYQGRHLHELTLDPFTCSEMLRLHFLSSGARLVSGPDGDTYRWQRRGGFTFADDAGVAFRHREHGIMRALVTNNIYDLDAVDKLKILCTLCTQLLTYATTRDIIDDGFERWRKAKREWQEEQWADQRKDKEEAAAKYRKKQEEKAKEREEKEKKLKENNSENPEEAKKEITKQDSSQQDSQPMSTEGVSDEQNSPKAVTRSQGPITEEPLICDDQNNEEFEREERKGRLKKKEKAFAKEIRKGQALSGIQPIGADRVFRRYWLFNSMNGLFIEDNDSELCKLLQPEDPEDESSDEDSEEDSTSETHETGERSTTPEDIATSLNPQEVTMKKQPSICSLTKQQIHEEKELFRILKLYGIPLESLPENSPLTRGELGEKRVENCEKFNTRNIVQWSYFDKKDDFDKLLTTLNPRGFREKYLREGLLQYYDTIVNGLEDNPLRLENRERSEVLKQLNNKRGGFRNQPQGVDKSLYKTMEDFIEANLRDNILDLEDRIWQGGLGSVKIEDITAWRKQVENGIYDFLPAAGTATDKDDGQVPMNGIDGDINGSGVEKMDVDEDKDTESAELEGSVDIKSNKPSFLPCLEDSRPGTPVDGSFAATPTTAHTPQAINPCVRSLAKAVMQVEQGIERKYLIPPLGDDEETKKRKQQEAADAARTEFEEMMTAAGKKKKDKNMKNGVAAESEKQENFPDSHQVSQKTETVAKQQKTLLERWEDSLMASTNLSQVYIHLTNLDNCISWDKSVLNARCRICRRKGDAEHMLLCDGCDRGHHMYCLKPPIKEVPEGDWFCSSCRPKEPRRSFRKNRGKEEENDEEPREEYKTKMKEEEMEESDDSDDEEEEDDDSSSDEDSDDDDDDDSDDDDDDDDEEENESDEAVGESDEEGSVHMETCACCDGGGELLCCEMCPLAFHLECAYPPLRRVPRGDWVCQVCTGADYELPAGRRVKKSVIKAATKRANESDISPKTTKRAKTSTKTTDTKVEIKKPASGKRQTVQSSSATPSPPPPAVRVSSRKTTTSSNLATASKAQSNPAPKKTTGPKKTAEKQTTSSKISGDSKAQSNPAPKKTPNAKLPGQKKTSEKQATSPNISTTPKTLSNSAPKKANAKLLAQKKATEQPATSPKISTAPKGLSNSAPKKTTNAKWSGQKKACEKLLKEMRDHEDSWPFLYPVNEIDVPDYFTFITTPMDFKTIETKLSSRQYHSAEEFAADVRQIFFNCSEYNKPRTREARSGVRLSALFETRFGELGLDGTENRSLRTRRSK